MPPTCHPTWATVLAGSTGSSRITTSCRLGSGASTSTLLRAPDSKRSTTSQGMGAAAISARLPAGVEAFDRLGDPAVTCLVPLRVGDPLRELLAVREGERVERLPRDRIPGEGSLERVRYLDNPRCLVERQLDGHRVSVRDAGCLPRGLVDAQPHDPAVAHQVRTELDPVQRPGDPGADTAAEGIDDLVRDDHRRATRPRRVQLRLEALHAGDRRPRADSPTNVLRCRTWNGWAFGSSNRTPAPCFAGWPAGRRSRSPIAAGRSPG